MLCEHYLHKKGYATHDRSQYELRSLAEMFEYGICYDQVNGPSLAIFELAARRWQHIISAHDEDHLKPRYDGV